ncbi:MAG: DNA mismatch repair protein MutS [Clostridia bacterium]|nr:DNA mismatch repair protein MutS [Clostridia bacterium]
MALSPMMQQYMVTKEQYKDAILLYRLGDFYEMFFEDAVVASKALDLTLTGRQCGLEERAPMCGIPYHAVDTYLAKLIEQGFKVAICEQITEPKKGVKLVERDVVRVITPGTLIDSNLLDDKKNNYILSGYYDNGIVGVAYTDISTGVIFLAHQDLSKFNDLLVRVRPSEIICNDKLAEVADTLIATKMQIIPHFQVRAFESFDYDDCHKTLTKQIDKKELIGLNDKEQTVISAGILINYLLETQKRSLSHINSVSYVNDSDFMALDSNTRRNLELTETIKDRKKRGSLLWLLDKTQTSMGSRMLRSYIEQPLYDEKLINQRLNGVEELVKNVVIRDALNRLLNSVYDIERLCGKVSYNNINPKDMIALKNSLSVLPQIKEKLSGFKSTILKNICKDIYDYSSIFNLLDSAIVETPPYILKDGGFIKQGFNSELDEIIDISKNGKSWIAALEAKEKEQTGIKNLKIGFNNVFGYYIEVSKTQVGLVPYNYQRKQTIANGERFITEELKEMENKILNAEDQRIALEIKLFNEIREVLLENVTAMQKTSRQIAVLDSLLSLATVACERNYCKPQVSQAINSIEIVNGRHPVVEALIKNDDFVPNDTYLDNNDARTMIITGPNMAGKSTYMRQVALITLMAHIGSFVPAQKANISLTDKIFTRVGASDDLAFGQSTFMVEMSEVSNILKQATNNSLIVLDEVGRGTSTFDGLSIAWSVMEYLSKTLKAKTLFATHYHELTELEGILEGVKNYRINVKEFNDSIIFLRKIVRGGANKSFGIEVAKLAGLPEDVITRAKNILHTLEENEINKNSSLTKLSENAESIKYQKSALEVANILRDVNVETLTPLNAFDLLIQLNNKVKKD